MIEQGSLIAVIDDDPHYAETTAYIVEEAGLTPRIITSGSRVFHQPSELISEIVGMGCTAAICDHRLRPQGFAAFDGAQAVAQLYQQHIPGALLSTFSAIDRDSSIRRYRSAIPSVIN